MDTLIESDGTKLTAFSKVADAINNSSLIAKLLLSVILSTARNLSLTKS